MATMALTVNRNIEEFIVDYETKNELSRSAAVRELLSQAIKAGCRAKPNSGGGTRVLRFSASTPETGWFFESARKKGKEGDEHKWLAGVLTGYIYKKHLGSSATLRKKGAGRPRDYDKHARELFEQHAHGLDCRKEQLNFVSLLAMAVDKRKIAMAEASTGVGKSIGMLLAASHATSNNQRVVIATPTIQVMRQLVEQYRHQLKDMPRHAVLMGRSEFVLKSRIESILEDDPEIDNAEEIGQWIKGGGVPDEDGPFEISWLAETLIRLAPTFPVRDVVIPRVVDEGIRSDPGFQTYQQLFELAGEVPLIFCTHAMLASDIQIRGHNLRREGDAKEQLANDAEAAQSVAVAKILEASPDGTATDEELQKAKGKAFYDTLTSMKSAIEGVIPGGFDCIFIDEAQALEAVIASSASLDISIYRLYQNAKHLTKLGAGSLKKIKRTYNEMIQDSRFSKDGTMQFGRDSIYHLRIKDLAKQCRAILGSLAKQGINGGATASEIRGQLAELDRISYEITKSGRICSVSWTPIRKYPRIMVGPQSVAHELEVLWGSVTSGGVVSASLYLPPPHNHAHMARVLNLPEAKLMLSPPIIAKWLVSPVTLYTPEIKTNRLDRLWLRYPDSKTKGEEYEAQLDLWAEETSKAVLKITSKAKGGTLILGTAYATNEELIDKVSPKLGKRLIVQSKEERFEATVKRYKQAYYDGKRPVLLALGRGWTGLDITDKRKNVPAKDDHMLSDLIMLRLPFGLNRSSTHIHRKKLRHIAEALESALLFKQGLGRLVRRRGVPDKNLWILDPRISSADAKHKAQTKYHREILKCYKRTKVVKSR